MMKNQIIVAGVIIILAACALTYFDTKKSSDNNPTTPNATPTPTSNEPEPSPMATQANYTDELISYDSTVTNVNFCGTSYRSPRVYVNNIDVIERVAYIATNDLVPTNLKIGDQREKGEISKQICSNISLGTRNGELDMEVETLEPFDGIDVGLNNQKIYTIMMEELIQIATPSGDIYLVSRFDGNTSGPIGNLK
jgi:hypothetical protein